MSGLGFEFTVLPADTSEDLLPGEDPFDAAERLARLKAATVMLLAPDGSVVVAADTIVVLDGEALGKPADREDAREMLGKLSARRHEVVTGVAVARDGKMVSGRDTTEVYFRPLTDAEIDAYASTEEPHDKAGAYALQGLGAVFIDKIDGSPSNVIGLPVCLLRRLLLDVGIAVPFLGPVMTDPAG